MWKTRTLLEGWIYASVELRLHETIKTTLFILECNLGFVSRAIRGNMFRRCLLFLQLLLLNLLASSKKVNRMFPTCSVCLLPDLKRLDGGQCKFLELLCCYKTRPVFVVPSGCKSKGLVLLTWA